MEVLGKQPQIAEEAHFLGEIFLFILFTKGEKPAIMYRLKGRCTGGSMDRASDSGSEGWGFESLPVYPKRLERTAECNEANASSFLV